MVGHGGSSAGSYLADPTSPIPSHCASTVATSTVRVKKKYGPALHQMSLHYTNPARPFLGDVCAVVGLSEIHDE